MGFQKANIFDSPSEEMIAHGGNGLLAVSRIFTAKDVSGACNFVDFTVIPEGASIGPHSHELDEEEYYLILEGSGRMSVDGETFEVAKGDLIRNRPGGTHWLENNGREPIQLFVFELGLQGE